MKWDTYVSVKYLGMNPIGKIMIAEIVGWITAIIIIGLAGYVLWVGVH